MIEMIFTDISVVHHKVIYTDHEICLASAISKKIDISLYLSTIT